MRALRLSFVGTLMLAVIGIAGSAMAEDAAAPVEEAGVPVFVTGIETCSTQTEGTDTTQAGVRSIRGLINRCSNTMSDARVSGTYVNDFNMTCYESLDDGGCIFWGTHVLDGPDGGWACSYTGTDDPMGANTGLVLGVCPGSGAYDGLTYMWQHVFGGSYSFGDDTSFYGLIFEGPPPPWGPLPE